MTPSTKVAADRLKNYPPMRVMGAQLKWAAVYENMGGHTMKTTIEIADDLFARAQRIARKEKTTFRALTERGLRLVLSEKQARPKKLPPLVTVPGALTAQFENAPWEDIRDAVYKSPGYFAKLRAISTAAKLKGAPIHDARIAALCLHHGVRELWSADRDFSAFPQLKTRNPLIKQ